MTLSNEDINRHIGRAGNGSLSDLRKAMKAMADGDDVYVGGTQITATGAELNILDGVTATAAEINRAVDISARIVTTTATALSLTVTEHAERIVLVNTNSTVANTITLPAAAGTGAKRYS